MKQTTPITVFTDLVHAMCRNPCRIEHITGPDSILVDIYPHPNDFAVLLGKKEPVEGSGQGKPLKYPNGDQLRGGMMFNALKVLVWTIAGGQFLDESRLLLHDPSPPDARTPRIQFEPNQQWDSTSLEWLMRSAADAFLQDPQATVMLNQSKPSMDPLMVTLTTGQPCSENLEEALRRIFESIARVHGKKIEFKLVSNVTV